MSVTTLYTTEAELTGEIHSVQYIFPYPKSTEIRMDMREWIQNNKCMQLGTHYPLCIKLGGIGRRSEEKQLERIKGTPQHAAKQRAKYEAGGAAYPSHKPRTPGDVTNGRRKKFGTVVHGMHSTTAQADDAANVMCDQCGGRWCKEETCPGRWSAGANNQPTASNSQSSAGPMLSLSDIDPDRPPLHVPPHKR